MGHDHHHWCGWRPKSSNRKVAVSQNAAKAIFIFNAPSSARARIFVAAVVDYLK